MGEARRRRAAGGGTGRSAVGKKDLRELADGLVKIDPSGRLLCAFGMEQREMIGRLLKRRQAGWSETEIIAAADREAAAWFAKGPRAIIQEFEETMRRRVKKSMA